MCKIARSRKESWHVRRPQMMEVDELCTSRIPTPASLYTQSPAHPEAACVSGAAHSWPARRCLLFPLKKRGPLDLGESSVWSLWIVSYTIYKIQYVYIAKISGNEFIKSRHIREQIILHLPLVPNSPSGLEIKPDAGHILKSALDLVM